ncbi:MAG TPA: 5-(carboxyamino)imidazole ribonucleotide synthase, partial [Alphaproteobacteria bacterium]|nr:5-(carboxyamino)imidazole ribonucleotide synthase [Alphaproteobacteria bacterium]
MKVGILGGGQLGRMLATAAHELGLRPVIVEPRPDCPASRVAPTLAVAYDDPAALRALADCDVVTYEFENVPAAAVRHLAGIVAVHPSPDALTSTADRLLEKRLFRSLGMPTPRFAAVDSERGLRHAIEHVGLPAVLKTRRFGYDGKGQARLHTLADAAPAWRRLGGQPSILEQLVAFDREISLIAVRGRDGTIRFWPPTENRHVDGILRIARAPVEDLDPAAVEPARRAMTRLLERLDYVGVLTVEFFVCGGAWLANEAACRVHNSGHWTLEGAVTSQFENHLRAVAGWPLGATDAIAPVAMANVVGH